MPGFIFQRNIFFAVFSGHDGHSTLAVSAGETDEESEDNDALGGEEILFFSKNCCLLRASLRRSLGDLFFEVNPRRGIQSWCSKNDRLRTWILTLQDSPRRLPFRCSSWWCHFKFSTKIYRQTLENIKELSKVKLTGRPIMLYHLEQLQKIDFFYPKKN